jgi:hypothetical protein
MLTIRLTVRKNMLSGLAAKSKDWNWRSDENLSQ